MAFITVYFPDKHHRSHQRQLAVARQGADDADRRHARRCSSGTTSTPDEKIKVYDKGVDVTTRESVYDLLVSYRSGDAWVPKVEATEALRDYRAVDYIASRPDWDGKTLVVMGTSMGGQQSLCVAGLHPKVTHVIVNEPAGCDTNGPLARPAIRLSVFPLDHPKIMETALYFDAVNFAPRIKVHRWWRWASWTRLRRPPASGPRSIRFQGRKKRCR